MSWYISSENQYCEESTSEMLAPQWKLSSAGRLKRCRQKRSCLVGCRAESGEVPSLTGSAAGDVLALLGTQYLLRAPPGPLAGAVDSLTQNIVEPLIDLLCLPLRGCSYSTETRLGSGSFGTVYKATSSRSQPIVVKTPRKGNQAAELQNAEEILCRRIRRAARARRAVPDFIGKYCGTTPGSNRADPDAPNVLCWRADGDFTLEELLEDKRFLERAEELVYKGEVTCSPERQKRAVKSLMRQAVSCVAALHEAGIAHRDVKPAHFICERNSGRLVLVDLGACVDLRNGFNFTPGEGVLDPRYGPPEGAVFPESVPPPPPPPLGTLLAPILFWRYRPTLFDSYSLGLLIVQLATPALRLTQSFDKRSTFSQRLRFADYDFASMQKSNAENFELLREKWKLGWDGIDLVSKLVCDRSRRISARKALAHPFLALPP